MIKWTDIDNEVEEFQSGYRHGFVAIFKKYEGVETDEKGGNGKILTVNVTSFASRYGIAERTFRRWVEQEKDGGVTKSSRPGPNARALAEAAAQATAAAEAKAAKALADALEAQKLAAEKAQREASLKAKQEQERALKAQQEAIRKEEQAKAKAAAERELAELRAKLAETAKSVGFDPTTLSEAQKAQVMTMLANDPEKAKEFFAAQTKERARKLQEEVNKQKAAEKRRKEQADEREAVKAAKAASKEYTESALCFFIEGMIPSVDELSELLTNKPVSFSHILRSGKTAQQLVELTEQMENLAVDMREAIFSANAEAQLLDIEGN